MRSLINYIGLRGAPSQNPASGEYLNRLLPGLPLEALVQVTEADQATFLEAWSDIQNRAAKRFNTEVIRAFDSRYRIRHLNNSVDLLKVIDKTNNQTAAAAEFRGLVIELTPDKEQLVQYSALQTIYVQTVRLYRKAATAAVSGKIFDLLTGEELSEFTVPANTAEGWTNITIEEYFSAQRLYIAFDATLINSVELNITESQLANFGTCAGEYFGAGTYTNLRGGVTSGLGAEIYDDDVTRGSNTFGLSAIFSVRCSYEPVVEQNKSLFLMAWAYLLGEEMLFTRINSSQINRWTIGIDKERAKELIAELQDRFSTEIRTVIDGINLNLADACLDCNDTFTYRESRL